MAHTSAPYMRSKSSRNLFSEYAFYMDFVPGQTPQNRASDGGYLSTVIPGVRYLNDGTLVPENVPSIEPGLGLRGVGQIFNYFDSPYNPTTQSVTLPTGNYTLWVEGTGSAEYNGNTATEGSPASFSLSVETTASCTISGVVDKCTLNNGPYPLPTVPVLTPTISEVATGDAEYGNFLRLEDFPTLVDAFKSQGELQVDWVPGYNVSDLQTIERLQIINVHGSDPDMLFGYNDSNRITSYDGVNATVVNVDWIANQSYTMQLMWGIHPTLGVKKQQIVINGVGNNTVDFDGSFDPAELLNFFFRNTELNYIKSIKVLKEPVSWV